MGRSLSSLDLHRLQDLHCSLSQRRAGNRFSGRSSPRTELTKASSKRRKASASFAPSALASALSVLGNAVEFLIIKFISNYF